MELDGKKGDRWLADNLTEFAAFLASLNIFLFLELADLQRNCGA
jgi:hypothetical protein